MLKFSSLFSIDSNASFCQVFKLSFISLLITASSQCPWASSETLRHHVPFCWCFTQSGYSRMRTHCSRDISSETAKLNQMENNRERSVLLNSSDQANMNDSDSGSDKYCFVIFETGGANLEPFTIQIITGRGFPVTPSVRQEAAWLIHCVPASPYARPHHHIV